MLKYYTPYLFFRVLGNFLCLTDKSKLKGIILEIGNLTKCKLSFDNSILLDCCIDFTSKLECFLFVWDFPGKIIEFFSPWPAKKKINESILTRFSSNNIN